MKFSEMPYRRADIEEAKADFAKLMTDFDNAKSGEEQFEVHNTFFATYTPPIYYLLRYLILTLEVADEQTPI